MTQPLDLTEVVSVLTQSLLDYRTRIADLQAKVAAQSEQLRAADLHMQAEKICHASKMHPKTRSAVFIGCTYFGDNTKYAFLDFIRAAKLHDCEARFMPLTKTQEAVVKTAGLPHFPYEFHAWSAKDIQNALGTSVAVHCDHSAMWQWQDVRARALFDGAKHIQLWHGISIKEIGIKFARSGDVFNIMDCEILATSGKFDVFVGTSRRSEAEWRRFFIFDRYEPLGYPRNDALLRDATAHDLLNVDLAAYERVKQARAEGKPVYVYAPTFRDTGDISWFPPQGFPEIVRRLAQRAVVLTNLHPFDQRAVPEISMKYPGLFFLQPGTDLYPILRYANALITDYSSLIFDFLLLDRPIVLYRPDHEHYQTESRTLFDRKLATPPGPLCRTAEELTEAIEGLLRGEDPAAATRRLLRQNWFDHPDGGAAARVTKLILEMLPASLAADQRRAV